MTRWLRTALTRSWAELRRERLDREFDEELTTHLELLVDECRRGGLSPEQARAEALRRLGRPALLRELHREQRGLPMRELVAQDLRYAVRMLAKSPGFTSVAVLSLGLGIGANTALFSLVDDLLLRSLPVREPERLVQIQLVTEGPVKKPWQDYPKAVFDEVRQHGDVLSDLVGFRWLDRPAVMIDGALEPPRQVEQVSENFFRDLGVTPSLGRGPEPSDDDVAVLSHRFWRVRFDGRSSALGQALSVDGRLFTIIGVAPPAFLGLSLEASPDLWVSPRTPADQRMIAHLKPGVPYAQAQAALTALFDRLALGPPGTRMRLELLTVGKGLSQLRQPYQRPLLVLAVLVTLLLLITCSNVGNLLMLRNAARRRELSVRVALGASRARLMLQCLVECLVLAALGGILALALARWGVSLMLSMLPLQAVPESLAFQADARVLSFAGLASLLSALLFGLAPAWRASQVDLAAGLRTSQGSTLTRSTRRLGRSLVACQVGLSLLLLVGAGLFVQTLRNLVRLDVGFDPESLLQVLIDTRGSGYAQGQVGSVYRLLLERVAAIPGVRSASGVRNPVMRNSLSFSRMRLRGLRLEADEVWNSAEVGPSFFETMGIPLVRGRTFTADDFARGRPLFVVSEAFVKRYYPGWDPVGDSGTLIVGVVKDAKLASVRAENAPMMYELARREPDRVNALEVRVAGDAAAAARAIAQEVRRVNPRLLLEVRTMRQEIDRSIAKERMVAATGAFFSLLGLLLASIGVFGVASHTVAQRTNELGIRMALGAGRWTVICESLRDTLRVCCAGLAVGTLAAIAGVRWAASFIADLLFGLSATDAANLLGAVLLMLAVAIVACILPVRRATRIDPLAAIRCE